MHTVQTKSITIATPAVTGLSIKGIASAALNWLVAKDQAYRNSCHMAELSDETLKDVGLTRDQIS